MNHNCVKCNAVYSDADPDAYLCAPCTEKKKAIAAQIDAQFVGRPSTKPASLLQEFERNGKTVVVDGRVVTFMKA